MRQSIAIVASCVLILAGINLVIAENGNWIGALGGAALLYGLDRREYAINRMSDDD